MRSTVFILLFFMTGSVWAQSIPNLEEFKDIALMTAIAAHAEDEKKLAKSFGPLREKEICEYDESEKKVVKEKPKISFYYKVTGPVDDMKTADMNFNPNSYVPQLASVVKASSEQERNKLISSLCNSKSLEEKIKFGSTLFNMLGEVYNYDLANGSADPYGQQDNTKNPDEIYKITLQRQYNSLNRMFYSGDSGFPPTAGVCRHASTLVADFLSHCGLQTSEISQIAYATEDAAHSVVQVKDPVTGKFYYLNWGEVKEGKLGPYTNFDIPSDSVPGRGMIIRYYTPDEKGDYQEFSRSNLGVVAARLLHVSNNELDFTSYRTNEFGGVIDLGTKKKFIKEGKWKEVDQEIILGMIDAQRSDFFGGKDQVEGASASYKRTGTKYFGDHLYWQNRMQASVGGFLSEDAYFTGQGYGVTHRQGMSLGVNLTKDKKTVVEVGGDVVAEFYQVFSKPKGANESSYNIDGTGYLIGNVKLKHEKNRNFVALEGKARLTVEPDMKFNNPLPDLNFAVFNPQISFIYARNLQSKKQIGVSSTYVGSIDRQFIRSEVMYADLERQFQGSTGFTVIKTPDNNQHVYTVVKIEKNFRTKPMDIKASVSAQKPLEKNLSPIFQGTVILSPHWKKH